eukprot:14179468-Alexandrium_andersonii.AAC.1
MRSDEGLAEEGWTHLIRLEDVVGELRPTQLELRKLRVTEPLVTSDVLNSVTHGHRRVRLQEVRKHPHKRASPEEPALAPQESRSLSFDLALEVFLRLVGHRPRGLRQRGVDL